MLTTSSLNTGTNTKLHVLLCPDMLSFLYLFITYYVYIYNYEHYSIDNYHTKKTVVQPIIQQMNQWYQKPTFLLAKVKFI